MSDAKPVKLVTSAARTTSEVVELLEGAIEYVKQTGDARAVVVGLAFERTPSVRFSVKYFGAGPDLLALGARITHEVNEDIDARNE